MKAPSRLVLFLVAAATLSLTTLNLNSASKAAPAPPSAGFHTANRSLSELAQECRYQLSHLTEGFSAYSAYPHRTAFPR